MLKGNPGIIFTIKCWGSMKSLVFTFLCLLVSTQIFSQQKKQNLNSLIATEYSFVAAAAEIGTRDAFLKFIADDGIIFRPNAVNGKKFLTDAPKRSGLLSWYPIHAEVSNAGDMGFTTGPAEFRKDKDSAAIWFGNFCTVWQKQSNGEWKFAIDIGNQNDKPLTVPKGLEYKIGAADQQQLIKGEKRPSPFELYILDRAFNTMTEKMGIEKSYRKFVNEESRILRDGKFPIVGLKQIIYYCSGQNFNMNFKPIDGKLSSSKDFGFTYGELEMINLDNKLSERFNYMHVYKKEGKHWVIAVEVANKREK